VESKLGPLGTSATEWPIVPAPGNYDDGEVGGMKIGRGNRRTRRKPAPTPLCPQIPLDQTRARTRAAAVGSQRLLFFLNLHSGGGVQMGSLGTSATEWPIVPAPGDYDDGDFGGMKIGRGNRSTRRKPASAPLCPPQIYFECPAF
jgi:hypothetical protein